MTPADAEGGKAFPIYAAELHWPETRDGKRIINSGSATYMFRRQPNEAELSAWLEKVWSSYAARATDPGRPVMEWHFLRWDTWCLRWFSHWTWDTGQSDAEALRSFEDYVTRTEAHNKRMRRAWPEQDRVLMGAEDRWRWSGAEPGDRCPPCRCDGCRENGVILICH